jgi:predicted transcriptional regulator
VAFKRWEKEEFIPLYKELKSQGLKEKEIAKELFISKATLTNYKKMYGLPLVANKDKKMLTNQNGLTKEMLEIAKENGLNSSLVNARLTNCHWTLEEAITIKPLKRGKKLNRGKVVEC